MPYRRPAVSLTLEELPPHDFDSDGLIGSDDEQDDLARAAKRRKIESLGESYLQGSPLFIASASLNGPFDANWSNPWKKHRKQQRDPVDTKVIPETGSKKKTDRITGSRVQQLRSTSVPHDDRATEVLVRRESPVTSISREQGRDRSWRSLFWEEAPTASHTAQRNALTASSKDGWLKKDKKLVNIQAFDPPNSPTARYAGSRNNVENAVGNKPQIGKGATLSRNDSPRQSDLRHIRRSKPLTGNSGVELDMSKVLAVEDPHGSGHNESKPPDQSYSKAEVLPVDNSTASRGVEQPLSAPSVRDDKQIDRQSSRSSVFIVPPSTHLPEFKYRRPNDRFEIKRTETSDRHVKSEFSRPAESMNKPLDTSTEHSVAPDDILFANDQPGISDSAQEEKSTGTVGPHDDGAIPSYPTESEFIPSAQVILGQLGTSDRLVSLYSTEFRVDKKTTEEDDNQLSTQAALLLAQKSFQDDLSTPGRDSRLSPIPDHKGQSCPTNQITPFSHINGLAEIKRHRSTSPDVGLHHTMNTQAMMDAITPFSFSTSKKSETWMGSETGVTKSASTSKRKKKTSFAVSPRSPSPNPDPVSKARIEYLGDTSQTDLSRAKTQRSAHGSSSVLPFTLSGSTPTTVQQDGQGLMAGLDTFDVNQVIQDAGSWLKQSWDLAEELKHRSEKSTQTSSQTHIPAISLV